MWKGGTEAPTVVVGNPSFRMTKEETGPLTSQGTPRDWGDAEHKPHLDSFMTLVRCLPFYLK